MGKEILLVGKGNEGKQILRTAGVSDEDMLQVIADSPEERGERRNLVSRLSSIIATKILQLQIKDGFGLLVPVASLVERNLRHEKSRLDAEGPKGGLPEGTLAKIYEKLIDTTDPQMKLHDGIVLGDTALHSSAGFVGSRHLSKIMSYEERQAYTRQMAFLGYLTALDSAKQVDRKTADSLDYVIRPIVERLIEVRTILKAICGFKDEKDEERDLQKILGGIVV